jgi:aerobic C4-dicarboxylate transport protein
MIKMTIAPLVSARSFMNRKHAGHEKVGRVGLKALIYFELVTTLALITGLTVINLRRPGVGMNVDPATPDAKLVAGMSRAHDQSTVAFLLDIIPNTFVGAFANGEMLQVLFLRSSSRVATAPGQ